MVELSSSVLTRIRVVTPLLGEASGADAAMQLDPAEENRLADFGLLRF